MHPNIPTDCFTNSILIVAHPDDEILWFSSILDKVGVILVCYSHSDLFPHLRSGREKSLAEYPLKKILSLRLSEAPVYDDQNWMRAQTDRYGLAIPKHNPGKSQYVRNYFRLKEVFKSVLTDYTNVFTHNPWGEYGHEEHVQLSLIVQELQSELGYHVRFPSYCSDKSFPLMFTFFPRLGPERMALKTNPELAQQIQRIYQRHDCWTWDPDAQWPVEETFLRLLTSEDRNREYYASIPVNALKIPPFKKRSRRSGTLQRRAMTVIKRLKALW